MVPFFRLKEDVLPAIKTVNHTSLKVGHFGVKWGFLGEILESDTPTYLKTVELIVLQDLIQKAFKTVDGTDLQFHEFQLLWHRKL